MEVLHPPYVQVLLSHKGLKWRTISIITPPRAQVLNYMTLFVACLQPRSDTNAELWKFKRIDEITKTQSDKQLNAWSGHRAPKFLPSQLFRTSLCTVTSIQACAVLS